MAVILTPDKWRRQPSGPVGIDYSNPLSLGLIFAPYQGCDMVSGRQMSTGPGTQSFRPVNARRYGSAIAHVVAGGSGQGGWIHTLDNPITDNVVTMAAVFYGGGFDDGSLVSISRGDSTTGYHSIHGSGQYGKALTFSGASSAGTSAAAFSNAGEYIGMAAIFRGASSRQLVSISDDTGVNTTSLDPGTLTRIVVGNSYRSGSLWWGVNLPIIAPAAWARSLSVDEAREYLRNPWQIFRKAGRIYFFPSAAGGATATGTLAVSDTMDTPALSGGVKVSGTLSVTDVIDIPAITGIVKVQGTFTPTDTADVFAANGSVSSAGVPTLSAATVTSIGTTSATPRVTLTFS